MKLPYTHTNHRNLSNDVFAALVEDYNLILYPKSIKTIKVSAVAFGSSVSRQTFGTFFNITNCTRFPSAPFLADQINDFVHAIVLPKQASCTGVILRITPITHEGKSLNEIERAFETLLDRNLPK